ncbi:MAG: SDR family NAD(P)-dependent oxidoreductase, partial [Firmicutes bacterium]|nr:SDR family NAD(P)-dependent oxidoreductase [Bacillota bacterium]
MQFDFTGKVAVITGGTVGMGYAAAELFGKSGAKVAICARSENKVKEAVEKLTAQGIDAI